MGGVDSKGQECKDMDIKNGCITDYTVSQNTLEQVFLKFAKTQV